MQKSLFPSFFSFLSFLFLFLLFFLTPPLKVACLFYLNEMEPPKTLPSRFEMKTLFWCLFFGDSLAFSRSFLDKNLVGEVAFVLVILGKKKRKKNRIKIPAAIFCTVALFLVRKCEGEEGITCVRSRKNIFFLEKCFFSFFFFFFSSFPFLLFLQNQSNKVKWDRMIFLEK